MERSNPLHNLNLPPGLTWGRQRTLKCMNINQFREMSDIDEDDHSSDSDEYIDVDDQHDDAKQFERPVKGRSRDKQKQVINFERPRRKCRSIDDIRRKSPAVKIYQDMKTLSIEKEEILVTREKLMKEYRSQIGKMKNLVVNNNDDEGEPSLIPMKSKSKQKLASNMLSSGVTTIMPGCSTGINEELDIDSRSEKISLRPRRNPERKEERPKFSISLSRKEIEEDFIAMSGKKPSRKPNRRPKNVQARLNALFPGSWLSEIHPDRYKVKESGKD